MCILLWEALIKSNFIIILFFSLKITFLEFFETLIGCAIKLYENQEALRVAALAKPPAADQASQHESTATDYITPLASAKTTSPQRHPSSKQDKDHHSRTTSSKNEVIKEEEEKKIVVVSYLFFIADIADS